MTKSIDQLVDEVIDREGGFVNHPADRGGPTRWGITEAVARIDGYRGSMVDLPRTRAADIYRRLYWSAPRFDAVAAIYPRVAAEMFDTGINMGVAVAGQFLQRSLSALTGARLVLDGAIGPRTLDALDQVRKARDAGGELALVKALDALQGERYISIVEARPSQLAFLFGWLTHRIGQA